MGFWGAMKGAVAGGAAPALKTLGQGVAAGGADLKSAMGVMAGGRAGAVGRMTDDQRQGVQTTIGAMAGGGGIWGNLARKLQAKQGWGGAGAGKLQKKAAEMAGNIMVGATPVEYGGGGPQVGTPGQPGEMGDEGGMRLPGVPGGRHGAPTRMAPWGASARAGHGFARRAVETPQDRASEEAPTAARAGAYGGMSPSTYQGPQQRFARSHAQSIGAMAGRQTGY
jgi:hypothetical protein